MSIAAPGPIKQDRRWLELFGDKIWSAAVLLYYQHEGITGQRHEQLTTNRAMLRYLKQLEWYATYGKRTDHQIASMFERKIATIYLTQGMDGVLEICKQLFPNPTTK